MIEIENCFFFFNLNLKSLPLIAIAYPLTTTIFPTCLKKPGIITVNPLVV